MISHQPLTLWRERRCGVVSGKLLTMMLAGASMWIFYGLSVNDPAVVWSTVPYLLVYITTLALWVKFRKTGGDRAPNLT